MGSPPTLAATTGVPQAWASTATSPKDSLCEGTASDVGRAVPLGEGRPVDRRHEAHEVADAALARRARSRPIGLRTPVPLAPPRMPTTSRERRSGRRRTSSAAASHEHVGRLERLDAPDEEEEHGIRGDAERPPAHSGTEPGRKIVEVDAGLGDATRSGSAP